MAASTATNIGLQYAWALGEDGWNTGMDSNLLKLDSLVQPNVIDSTLTTPPGSPAQGDRYIPATGSGGAWAGLDNKIVVYANSTWVSYTPQEGWIVYDNNTNEYLKYDGTNWSDDVFSQRYTFNAQTGTSYAIIAGDVTRSGRVIVTCANASPVSVTIPTPTSIGKSVGDNFTVMQTGAGAVTLSGSGGATVSGNTNLVAQYDARTVIASSSTAWLVVGG